MGGFGSGRHSNKRKVDDCLSIDVNKLRRAGCLKPGYHGELKWSVNGEQTGVIDLLMNGGRLILDYQVRRPGEDWAQVEEAVPIEWRPCRYGGQRPYFRCPGGVAGKPCGRRVAKLHCGGGYFLCRVCGRLRYACQAEPRVDRQFRRADKRRIAMGGLRGLFEPYPAKPRGMWWRTYDRHIAEISNAEAYVEQAAARYRAMF